MFGDDHHTFNQELRNHVGQCKTNRLSDDLRLNKLGNEFKHFDWSLDKDIKDIEDQVNNIQSLQKVNTYMGNDNASRIF